MFNIVYPAILNQQCCGVDGGGGGESFTELFEFGDVAIEDGNPLSRPWTTQYPTLIVTNVSGGPPYLFDPYPYQDFPVDTRDTQPNPADPVQCVIFSPSVIRIVFQRDYNYLSLYNLSNSSALITFLDATNTPIPSLTGSVDAGTGFPEWQKQEFGFVETSSGDAIPFRGILLNVPLPSASTDAFTFDYLLISTDFPPGFVPTSV